MSVCAYQAGRLHDQPSNTRLTWGDDGCNTEGLQMQLKRN